MTYASGEVYHGSWKGGVREGQGTMYYANGDLYTGQWVAGRKQGVGTYVFKASGARCTGTFYNNKVVDGGFVDTFGNAYTGRFRGVSEARVDYDLEGKFELASGAKASVPAEKRLVLYASNTPHPQDFVAMMLPSVVAISYDFENATCEDLVGVVSAAVKRNGCVFKSMCFANHGDAADLPGFAWPISKKICIKAAGNLSEEVKSVLKAFGAAVEKDGRVDLLACSLIQTAEGRQVFHEIQELTATHFASSDDMTGSVSSGGDWIMESDGVDIGGLYFGDTSQYVGTFMASAGVAKAEAKAKAATSDDGDSYTVAEQPVNVTEGSYLMVGKEPCIVERRMFFRDTAKEGGGWYKYICTALFTSFKSGTAGGVNKTDLVLETSDAIAFVQVPIVQKHWWQVSEVIADQKTPDMPDSHDTIVLKNPSMLIYSPGCPPGELRLHALRKGSDIFIDLITGQLRPGQKVEVQVRNACGQNEIVMKNFIKDIKITSL